MAEESVVPGPIVPAEMTWRNTTENVWDVVVDERRRRIAAQYLKGTMQSEIARQEGVSPTTVSRDLAIIRKKWRESAMRDFDEAVGRELASIDVLEKEYWDSWQRSRGERTRQRTRSRKDGDGADAGSEESTLKEQRDGNPRFLEGVRWCIDRRCKLLGLDAPVKHDIELNQLTPEQRRDRLLAVLAELRESCGPGPAVIEHGEVAGPQGAASE